MLAVPKIIVPKERLVQRDSYKSSHDCNLIFVYRRELVAGFSSGQLELADPAAQVQSGKKIIAKLENTFQVGVGPKKFNPSR